MTLSIYRQMGLAALAIQILLLFTVFLVPLDAAQYVVFAMAAVFVAVIVLAAIDLFIEAS